MILSLAAVLTLAGQCAPAVAPETLLAVAAAESGFDALAVAVNGRPRRVYHPASLSAAGQLATRLVRQGLSVDLGLGQINSRNLARLGLSPAEALDPCRNLAASAQILSLGFQRAATREAPQAALATAFSLYNTGDPRRGRRNGYVARVRRAAAQVVPAIELAQGRPAARATRGAPTDPPAPASPSETDWTAPTASSLAVF